MNMQRANLTTYASLGLALLIAGAAAFGIVPAPLTPEQLAAFDAVLAAVGILAHAKTDKAPPAP